MACMNRFSPPIRRACRGGALGALVLGLVLLFAARGHAAQQVRIAVGHFKSHMQVDAPRLTVTDASGHVLYTGRRVKLRAGKKGITLGKKALRTEIVRIRAEGNLKLRGFEYRNALDVLWQKKGSKKELLVIHPLPLETYVAGIVSAEVPSSWPLEALKAQAIAARTFAVDRKYARLHRAYHMESSVLDQVYGGAQREHPGALRAARETYGQVLAYKRRPAKAYFHAASGGHTESALEGWGSAVPYLPGTKCNYGKQSNRWRWSEKLSDSHVDKALRGQLGAHVERIRILSKTKTGRMKRVELRGGGKKRRLSGPDLRRLLGYSRLRSTWVTRIRHTGSTWTFDGRGSGHGVGMCQWGAKGRAEAGQSYAQILQAYYPGTHLERMY